MLVDMSIDARQYATSLKRLGATGIMRYFSRGGGSKCLTKAELDWLFDQGYMVGIVSEVWGGTRELAGSIDATNGTEDGNWAAQQLTNFGLPSSTAVYFCIDTDVDSDAQINQYVVPYLKAAAQALGSVGQPGVYGAGSTCAAALDACGYGYTMLAQSTGWTAYHNFVAQGRATIEQGPDHGWYDGPNKIVPASGNWGGFLRSGS